SLGLNHVKYNKVIAMGGTAFSILISLLFALMPISIYFHFIN
ncbi:MAG: succinate dehydrogenase, partial [Marivirga sp.]|nr:succinate dehydrogenase [Marivirga sp.]